VDGKGEFISRQGDGPRRGAEQSAVFLFDPPAARLQETVKFWRNDQREIGPAGQAPKRPIFTILGSPFDSTSEWHCNSNSEEGSYFRAGDTGQVFRDCAEHGQAFAP
jgi:hypothetical protein